jgi:hypothetical protein
MSVECSECERDLRGGHDPSCSRYDRAAADEARASDERWETVFVEIAEMLEEEDRAEAIRAERGDSGGER